MLIHSLESRIFLPHELVYLIGEQSNEMFFVARGDLKQLDPQGKVIKYYSDGDYFGEDLVQLNGRRTATVSSLGHSELLVLSKINMNLVSQRYPEFALILFKWSHDKMWESLSYWERIQYAVETQKNIKVQNGISKNRVTFIETYQHLKLIKNAISPRASTTTGTTLSKARLSVLAKSNNKISYDEFNGAFAEFYASELNQEAEEEIQRKKMMSRRKAMTFMPSSINKLV